MPLGDRLQPVKRGVRGEHRRWELIATAQCVQNGQKDHPKLDIGFHPRHDRSWSNPVQWAQDCQQGRPKLDIGTHPRHDHSWRDHAKGA